MGGGGRPELGASGAAGAARGDGGAVPVEPQRVRVREQFLRRGHPGGLAELEGAAVRLAGRRERDHGRQATGVAVGVGTIRADLRVLVLVGAGAAGTGRRGRGRAARRDGAAHRRGRRGPARRRRVRPHPGGGTDVPVQQSGRAARAAAGRCRLRDGAGPRAGELALAHRGRDLPRVRVPHQARAGVPDRAGPGAGLPDRRADGTSPPAAAPAGRTRRDHRVRRMVRGPGRPVAGRFASLHRRVDEQQPLAARARLQRSRTDLRCHRRLRLRWRRWWRDGRFVRWADRHHPAVRRADGRGDLLAAARRAPTPTGPDCCSGVAGSWSAAWCSAT